jgi:hypothetical protein
MTPALCSLKKKTRKQTFLRITDLQKQIFNEFVCSVGYQRLAQGLAQ